MSTRELKVRETSRGPERGDPIDYLTLRDLQDLPAKIDVRYKRNSEARQRIELNTL